MVLTGQGLARRPGHRPVFEEFSEDGGVRASPIEPFVMAGGGDWDPTIDLITVDG